MISIFANRLAAGKTAMISGDGGQRRSFVYVGDCVRFVMAVMDRATTDADVFYVCTGAPSSLQDLTAALSAAGSRDLNVEHGPARIGDIGDSFGDASRTTAAFGIRAEMPLRDGLAGTLESLRP